MARRRRIRRRSSRRRAAPRRSRRGRIRRRVGRFAKGQKSLFAQVSNGAGLLVFFSQLTGKDRENGAYAGNNSMADNAKTFANNVFGRLVGVQPFQSHKNPAFEQTINPDGMWNKWVGLGLGGWAYGQFAPKSFPHRGKAKTLGKKIGFAGLIGGLFDAPENDNRNRVQSQRASPQIFSTGRQMSTI